MRRREPTTREQIDQIQRDQARKTAERIKHAHDEHMRVMGPIYKLWAEQTRKTTARIEAARRGRFR